MVVAVQGQSWDLVSKQEAETDGALMLGVLSTCSIAQDPSVARITKTQRRILELKLRIKINKAANH